MRSICFAILLTLWGFYAGAIERSQTVVYINGEKYYVHTVRAGETLYGLAKCYGVSEQVIQKSNPSLTEGLKTDANIRIPYLSNGKEGNLSPKKLRKTFDQHYVSKGETLYAISRRYEIPIATLMADNADLDPTHLKLGQRILIRKKQIGTESEAGALKQWEDYRNTLNSVSDSVAYHIVQAGETFYSLSRRFGISELELGNLNNGLKAEDLKAGAMLRVPNIEAQAKSIAHEQPLIDSTTTRSGVQLEFRALPTNKPLKVALLLPMSDNGRLSENYMEFYQGFLLGLDSVKMRNGYSVDLTLYDTRRSADNVKQIIESPQFAGTQLIVGPVYEEELQPVIRYAEKYEIPVVSPLANITRTNSDALFQMAPLPTDKYEKVATLLEGKQITLIYAEKIDKTFEKEMLALLGERKYNRFDYRYEHHSVHNDNNEKKKSSTSDLSPLLENQEDNLFIIMASDEIEVDRILAALASADTNITARGRTAPRYVVLGNTKWNRYTNIDRAMFFKNRVIFTSTYHAKRDAATIVAFDAAYLQSFGALPTLYSYRGYDAAAIFCPAMYNDIEYNMEGKRYTPLQTTYLFKKQDGRDNHINRNWTQVRYNKDYTITLD